MIEINKRKLCAFSEIKVTENAAIIYIKRKIYRSDINELRRTFAF